jgi:hypothetical protein
MDTVMEISGGSNWFGRFLTLIVIAVLGCILFSVCEHAVEKHGEDALIVDNCLSTKGAHLGVWQRKSDLHLAFPCLTDTGKFGIKFNQCTGDNCTALIKEKMKKLWQIVKYLKNTGYEPLDDLAKSIYENNPAPGEIMNDW